MPFSHMLQVSPHLEMLPGDFPPPKSFLRQFLTPQGFYQQLDLYAWQQLHWMPAFRLAGQQGYWFWYGMSLSAQEAASRVPYRSLLLRRIP